MLREKTRPNSKAVSQLFFKQQMINYGLKNILWATC